MTIDETKVREDAEQYYRAYLIKIMGVAGSKGNTNLNEGIVRIVAYALERDRAERKNIPSIDYVQGGVDARKDIESIEAGLVRLAGTCRGVNLYCHIEPDKKTWIANCLLPGKRNYICYEADTPGAAVKKAVEELNEGKDSGKKTSEGT